MSKDKLISIVELRSAIFISLKHDETRSNMLYDRILFDYGYYDNGLSIKKIKGCIFYYNYICGLGNNEFQEGIRYQFRIKNEEINQIITLLRSWKIN